jgi:uncharacterized protein YndB with AHSA1/START domain
MPTFDDETDTPAAPEEVWKALYDPARFPEWWSGLERVVPGDAKGGDGDFTIFPEGYPDFPMPQQLSTRLQEAAEGWRRRAAVPRGGTDAGNRWAATLADIGRPVVGTVEPELELAAVLRDLDGLEHAARRATVLEPG